MLILASYSSEGAVERTNIRVNELLINNSLLFVPLVFFCYLIFVAQFSEFTPVLMHWFSLRPPPLTPPPPILWVCFLYVSPSCIFQNK